MNPAWRFTRATELADSGVKRFNKSEDPWVVHMAQFLRAYDTAADASALEVKYPALLWAHRIFDQEYRGPRFHLEALVMADYQSNDIAEFLDLPLPIIEAYERCYFDIRRHLSRPVALRAYLHARVEARGLRDLDPDPFWKTVAMDGGVKTLLALWGAGTLDVAERRRFDELIASQARRNAFKAAHARSVSAKNANLVIQEYTELMHAESERQKIEAEAGFTDNPVRELLSGLYHSISFTVAPVRQGSEQAFIEMSDTVASAPALLARLQGAEVKNEVVPEISE